MIIPSKFNGYTRDGVRRLYMGGGSGGGGQTSSKVENTNIPEYAKPYVETMLGATQQQLFQGTQGPSTTNPETGQVTPGNFNITGFKPYQAYGGTYDSQGNQTSYDPSKAIAGFSPLQQQSQQTIAGMQVPGQYQTAADITGAGIMGAADIGAQARAFNPMAQQAAGMGQQYQKMATDPNAISAYMSPYMQNVVDVQNREAMRNSQIAGTQQQGQATQAGAFGGSRDAIMRAERERNLGTLMNQNQAQGSQNAFQQAQQAQQYGANLGLQGIQTGANIYGQGLTAQQQAIQQAMSGAGQLAGLGTQALEAQKGIAGLQGQVGAQQQGLEQQKINQSMQDYANAQQYPLMQLGTMSNMLRGLPMQSSTTNQYTAAPNALSQGIGTIGAGASIYNAFNPKPYAKGGGIMSYDVGGEVESDLESMSNDALAKEAKESPSPTIRQKAQRILRERQMERSAAPEATQPQMPEMPEMRGGGIIAFAKGDTVYGGPSSEAGEGDAAGYDAAGKNMEERLATEPTGGIMGAAPAAAAPTISKSNLALQRAPAIPDFLKAQYADAEKREQMTGAEHMAETEKLYAAAGVGNQSEGQQKQRAEMMAEKANLAADNERTKNLRMAEFFAKWGSTPGPTLVAGLNALKESVPNIVADEKEQKKIRREIDKSIADLDNATRLEKRGDIDKGQTLRLQAAENMRTLRGKIVEYQSKRESDASTAASAKYGDDTRAASSKYVADLNLRGEQLRANSSSLDRKAARETADDRKRFDAYTAAATQEQRLIAKITDQTNGKQYQKDLEDIKIAKMPATDAQGNFDPSKVPPPLRPGYEAALARIKAQQDVWDKQKDAVAKDTDLAYRRVQTLPERTTTSATNNTNGARPLLTDPSLQKQ